ncbi:MAG: alpha/beta hydrolase [Pseudobdellovibrio sp.]
MNFKKYIPIFIKYLSQVSSTLAARVAVNLFLTPKRYERLPAEQFFWSSGRPITFASGCKGRVFGDSQSSDDKIIWFVHGWESRSSRFEVFIEASITAGYQVIAWDGPAHGDSGGKRTNILEFANFLCQDALAFSDLPIHTLVGHSFGAGACAYACLHGFRVKNLVLISAPSSVRNVFERFWQTIQLGDKAKKEFIKQVERDANITVDEISLVHFISKLSQNIVLIHDHDDKEIPIAEAEELKQINPEITLIKTEKLGHRRILGSKDLALKLMQTLG